MFFHLDKRLERRWFGSRQCFGFDDEEAEASAGKVVFSHAILYQQYTPEDK
jgi:hypothetical protein